jgi:hypothetical protein
VSAMEFGAAYVLDQLSLNPWKFVPIDAARER